MQGPCLALALRTRASYGTSALLGRTTAHTTVAAIMQLAWRWHLLLATLALLCGHGTSFPALYEARYANSCSDHPTTHFGKVHDYTSAPDK